MPPELRLLKQNNICRHAGERPWYAGTAILAKQWFVASSNTFDHSEKFYEHGRITEVELEGKVLLLNWYFPNGGTRADGTEMLSYKLAFYDELETYVQGKQKDGYEIILTWDMNIVHTEIDIARPKENQNSIWFLPVERMRISDFMQDCGMTDMFRHFHPEKLDEYTRWSYRAGARARNVWRRIDYFMCSKGLLDKVVSCTNRQDIMWSDHCPVELIIDL
jgi:exodeoxyribonuclease-3